MTSRTLIRYALLALIVIILGALAGWYFFLHSQSGTTAALNAARGFGTDAPEGTLAGSTGISDTSAPASNGSGTTNATLPPQLWHVATAPVAGIGFATTTPGTRVRYVERATGYLFEADPTTGVASRLTNMLTAKTYEASFATYGRVTLRSLDASGGITTYAGVVTTATSSSLSGVSLARNIVALAADPKTAQVLYVRPQGTGAVGMTAGWDGSKQKQIFASPLSDWRVWWLADGRIILSQKAADGLAGYAYTLKNGSLNPLIGPMPGLTILPRTNSSALLYGTASSDGLALFVQISATTSAVRLAIATTPDKCVWAPGPGLVAYCAVPQAAPSPGFLSSWYRGEVHSSDALWRIDASAGQAQLIFTPDTSVTIDVTNPVMDESGSYIAFMNSSDQSAWLLRLTK